MSSPTTGNGTGLAALLGESDDIGSLDFSSMLAYMSAVTQDTYSSSTEADDLIRGQGMSSLASLSQDVWDTLQCYAVTSDVGNDVLTWDRLLAAAKDSPSIKLSTQLSHQELQLTSLSGLTVSKPTSCTLSSP